MNDLAEGLEVNQHTIRMWKAGAISLVKQWKRCTLEICKYLYPIREAFSRTRPGNVANETLPTWGEFLESIGLHRSTAHRWLDRYDPETGKIRAPEPKQIAAPRTPVDPVERIEGWLFKVPELERLSAIRRTIERLQELAAEIEEDQ